jgi:hypothetical protein
MNRTIANPKECMEKHASIDRYLFSIDVYGLFSQICHYEQSLRGTSSKKHRRLVDYRYAFYNHMKLEVIYFNIHYMTMSFFFTPGFSVLELMDLIGDFHDPCRRGDKNWTGNTLSGILEDCLKAYTGDETCFPFHRPHQIKKILDELEYNSKNSK